MPLTPRLYPAVWLRSLLKLVDADVADLHPEFHRAGDRDADATRSVKTATEEDDEGAASCRGESCNSVPETADTAGVVCRSYGCIVFSGDLLPISENAIAATTPDESVDKAEPASGMTAV